MEKKRNLPMVYKKKLFLLSTLVGLLALVYLLTLFFDPERVNSRNAAYSWLDPKSQDLADAIEIAKAGDWGNPLRLTRLGNAWSVIIDGAEFPAKKDRVEDLLRLLSGSSPYPVRGSSAASHERMGLTETSADRILVNGGAGLPLLDLLIGSTVAAGQEVYLRKNNQNEVRSGENKLYSYINSAVASWCNLRLFSEQGNQVLDSALVQRITVLPLPPEDGAPNPPLVITRKGVAWTIGGIEDESLDTQKVDSYVRGILDAEGEGFVSGLTAASTVFTDGRIEVELGNRNILTLNVGSLPAFLQTAGEPTIRRGVTASGSPYVYSLADWTLTRLFRERDYFMK
jgi:hypothetical protein